MPEEISERQAEIQGYSPYDAYPQIESARDFADYLMTPYGSVFPPPIQTKAVVVDLGTEGGRLRYVVYVKKVFLPPPESILHLPYQMIEDMKKGSWFRKK